MSTLIVHAEELKETLLKSLNVPLHATHVSGTWDCQTGVVRDCDGHLLYCVNHARVMEPEEAQQQQQRAVDAMLSAVAQAAGQ